MTISSLSFSNDELSKMPELPVEVRCSRCRETHTVESRGKATTLQTVKCGKDSYLVGINWVDVR
jgi:hypothetical protein